MNLSPLENRNSNTSLDPAPLVLVVCSLILIAFFYSGSFAFFFDSSHHPFVKRLNISFRQDAQELESLGHRVEGEWIFRKNNLSLPPGGEGKLVIRLSSPTGGVSRFRLFTPDIQNEKIQISAAIDDLEGINVNPDGSVTDLKNTVRENLSRLEINASVKSSSDRPIVILKRIERVLFTPESKRIFPFPVFLFMIFSPLAVYYVWCGRRRFVAALICLGGAIVLPLIIPSSQWWMPGYFLAWVVIPEIVMLRNVEKPVIRSSRVHLLLLGVIIILAAYLRWPILVRSVGNLLDPDARGYLAIAKNGKGLFQTSCDIAPYVREPLFIWFIRSMFLIGVENDAVLRFLTMLLSLGVIAGTYYFGRERFGRKPALLAALFCAVNPYFIQMSARGLRMELYILCVLFFLDSADRMKKTDAWSGLRCGAAAGACVLARITSFSFTIPLTLYFIFRRKGGWKNAALALAIPVIMIIPHLRFNYVHTGDPMYSSSIHASFYRNLEFAGEPGFPSKVEVRENPYTGEAISSFKYIFGLHSFPEIIAISFKGLYRIFFRGYVLGGLLGGSVVLYILYLFGLGYAAFSRRWDWLIAAIVLEAPSAFLAGMRLDWRLTLHVGPLLYLFTSSSVFFLAHKFKMFHSLNHKSNGG